MNKFRLTKRDVFLFFLGIFSVVSIDLITDFDSYVSAFNEGRNAARNEISK
ncbi:hypothetical protein [Flammeovirga sp. SJP92]|uniref:hypothetical protein n=1 Tax=Flammeovirga sp. SJP92 TaxID=1775430 RepID=UPI0012FBBA82|nr:hypothetical protein [Flammeovirga sp. SJP92]